MANLMVNRLGARVHWKLKLGISTTKQTMVVNPRLMNEYIVYDFVFTTKNIDAVNLYVILLGPIID